MLCNFTSKLRDPNNIYQINISWKYFYSRPHFAKGSKKSTKWKTKSPTYPFLLLIQRIQVATGSTTPNMTAVFLARRNDKFIEIKTNLSRKTLYRTKQKSICLGFSFSNRDNVRDPNQFRRERQSHSLKRWFFFKNRLIHFHTNSTRVIRTSNWNKSSWIHKALSTSFPQCLVDQIQVQKLLLLPQIRCLITIRLESSVIDIDSNIR